MPIYWSFAQTSLACGNKNVISPAAEKDQKAIVSIRRIKNNPPDDFRRQEAKANAMEIAADTNKMFPGKFIWKLFFSNIHKPFLILIRVVKRSPQAERSFNITDQVPF